MQGKKPYSEKLFTSFQLSARVPEVNFYRRLREILDLRWLYKSTKKYYGTEGQESIDPVVFFKMILIGYLENLASDRRIISTVSMRLDMLYFIGYDIDEPLPWHSTLSRTRQLYGQEVFKELFREILKQCIDKGMVAGRRQAIDSAFVKANASMDSLTQKEVLEDGDIYTTSLKEEDDDEAGDKKPSGNASHYSTTDADARIAKKPGKPTQLYYLAQVGVDTAGHVITNIEAHFADKRDSECLNEVVEGVVENLRPQGLVIEEVLADTNYSSGEALQFLEDNQITGYIPNLGQYKAKREGFNYDQQNDCYVCSRGAQLKYIRTYISTDGHNKKEYRSSSKDCSQCPLRIKCIGKSQIKRITETVDKPLYDQMHERMQTNKARRMMKLRQSTAEPVLGTLINFLGMSRVNTRGIELANKCLLLAATAYNLKKLLKFQAPKSDIIAKMIEKMKETLQITTFLVSALLKGNYNLNRKLVIQFLR
jgi:transposase